VDLVALVEDGVADAAGQAVVPEPAVAHDRDAAPVGVLRVQRGGAGRPEAISHRRRAEIERRVDGEQMAADVGADVVFTGLPLGELQAAEDRALGAPGAQSWWPRLDDIGRDAGGGGTGRIVGVTQERGLMRDDVGQVALQELVHAAGDDRRGVLARNRKHVLAVQRGGHVGPAQDRVEVLLDVVRLALFEQEHGAFTLAELDDLVVDDRVGHVHDVHRHLRTAVRVRAAEQFQRPVQRVVQAALDDDADVGLIVSEHLVELALFDESDGRGPTLGDLLLLVHETRRR
jgi:hypothetical protein